MTRDELRDIAAQCLGFKDYASAGPEKSWIDRAVVRAIYKTYQPDDSSRQRWAEELLSFFLPAPVTVLITLTQGSNDFTHSDDIPATDFLGSYLLIGNEFYTYAKRTDAANGSLAEPYRGSSGTFTAKFFHNSYVIEDRVFSVLQHPELIGYGKLHELSGKPQEIDFRSVVYNDYWPRDGVFFYNTSAVQHGSYSSFLVGDPTFYYVDDTMLAGVPSRRFLVHPLPEQPHTVRFRATVGPTIPASGNVPFPGPSDMAEAIFPPILEKICSSSKRYAGKNQRELAEEYGGALRLLRSFSVAQKRRPTRTRPRRGW